MLSFSTGPDAAQNIQTMRLRDDPPPITQQQRPNKKRKTPPTAPDQQQQQQQPQPQPQPEQQQLQQPQQPQVQPIQVLPPPHTLIHALPGGMPPGYPYAPTDYTPGGIPTAVQMQPPPQQGQQLTEQQNAQQRTLSSSKRAEQNRKAQRAFRERRDQHVKALESRSQLLDAALASADEANRRWEECRALVDQLRVENAALRAALSQAHLLPPNLNNQQPQPPPPMAHNPTPQEEPEPAESTTEPQKNDTQEGPSD
ncbi:hypothetical protein CPB83DRAFT_853076 [Crepidotus variabilis]|uniref:BZIP domain-containing protein n=1 Tax=Crepidotus variabilis TaxID=179855 RepID=A0A9P6EHR5_9AGAR|nr:hypothetical protein CPB83DRAFT_853076 [Crepidotus variabilis]